MNSCVKPICCPPEYCVHDHYVQRMVPVIHPVVTINRQNIINVPQHYYQQTTRNVVVNQGFPGQGYPTQGLQTQGFPTQGFPTQGLQTQGFPANPACQCNTNCRPFFLSRR